MKKKQILMVGILTALIFGTALVSSAQTFTPLTCNVSASSVQPNVNVTLTANGGTGTYSWSGFGLTSTTTSSHQNTVNYSAPGSYIATVISGTQSANCFVTVTSPSTSGGNTNTSNGSTLFCSPSTQSTTVGRSVSVSASGGTGSYVWSAPELAVNNPNGSGFTATYQSAGIKTLRVMSGNQTATCSVTVIGGSVPTVPTTPTTPGLPNTGGGFGK